jgi:hypothetical protein
LKRGTKEWKRSRPIARGSKRLPAKSPKTADRDRELATMTASMMLADPTCHVRSPHCTGAMSCLHHIVARSVAPERVLDPANVVRSCHSCNMWIETADGSEWAEAVGMKKRSWDA